jgi:predicted nucleic acid-binding protein
MRTTNRFFVDTNIWLYMLDVEGAVVKSQQAAKLLSALAREGSGVISVQVQGEFASVCTRKLALRPNEVLELLEAMKGFSVQTHKSPEIAEALQLMGKAQVSFWDALMLISAQQAGCKTLLTEDLNHGQVIEGVRIHNPFIEMPNL